MEDFEVLVISIADVFLSAFMVWLVAPVAGRAFNADLDPTYWQSVGVVLFAFALWPSSLQTMLRQIRDRQ